MNLQEQFKLFISNFDIRLLAYLDTRIADAKSFNPVAETNLIELKHLVQAGGKRVRPALVHYTSQITGKEATEESYKLGMALELFHTFALIHDDIIDESLTRRGFPTMEASYQKQFASMGFNQERSHHYALSATILGGDYGHVLADQIVARLDLDPQLKDAIQEIYYQMQFELCAGQLDDCFGIGLSDWDNLDEVSIDKMLKAKSGNYSIQKPILMGAKFAGVSEEQLAVLSQVGEDIGLVFQFTDDILGVFGEEDATGKSVSSDITEGKRNLLFARTYWKCDDSEKKTFREIVGNPTATVEQIQWVKDLMKSKQTVQELMETSEKLISTAVQHIETTFNPETPGALFICHLAKYLLTRNS